MRRLPLAVLAAAAVVLVMYGGYRPPTGFEGVVYNATITGDVLFSSCGISAERRWAVWANGTLYVVPPGAVMHVSGPVKIAELYATVTYPDVPWGRSFLSFHLPVGKPSDPRDPLCFVEGATFNYVDIFIGIHGESLPYYFRADPIYVGYPICDSRVGYDSLCQRCQNYATVSGYRVCIDYRYARAGSLYYRLGDPSGGSIQYGSWFDFAEPNASDVPNIYSDFYSVQCDSGVCVLYKAGSVGAWPGAIKWPYPFMWVYPEDGVCYRYTKNNPIGAWARVDLASSGRVPMGFPLAVIPQWNMGVYNRAPFIMSTEEFLHRIATWSKPHRTVYGRFHVSACYYLDEYGYRAFRVMGGWIVVGYDDKYVDAGSLKGERVVEKRTSTGWVAVPFGSCAPLVVDDIVDAVYSAEVYGIMCQVAERRYPLLNVYKLDTAYAVVGEQSPITLLLPPIPRVVGHGEVVVREEVLGEAAVVEWARGAAEPQCPRSDGREWPGIRGLCYGRAVVGVIAHGRGYIDVEYE